MTPDEWRAFVTGSVTYINAHLGRFWESEMLHYIGTTPDEVPAYPAAWAAMPGKGDYE